MTENTFYKIRLYFTGAVAIVIWSLLAWNHFHGGVPAHHFMANEAYPAISNWWGALLLPLLAWFLTYRIQKRIFDIRNEHTEAPKPLLRRVLYGFAGALLFGIAIAICFTLGLSDVTGYMVLALIPVAFFFPIYRAECLLGFVVGMSYTFGAILPTVFGILVSLVGLVLYLYIRPAILYVLSKFALLFSSRKHKPQQ